MTFVIINLGSGAVPNAMPSGWRVIDDASR